DFMYPLGMTGRKKVSDILTEAKVPAALRKVIYVLAKSQSSGEVYWVPGARLSRLIAVSDQTTGICRWTEDD
ncbi:MAG TPA: tRNA(Ile)-lysidine synthetase, partial [Cryomorphaceae bacterium]|nr:tRNA(Ile)-lysidine synthetase [Cryomorphaceae bacterium]